MHMLLTTLLTIIVATCELVTPSKVILFPPLWMGIPPSPHLYSISCCSVVPPPPLYEYDGYNLPPPLIPYSISCCSVVPPPYMNTMVIIPPPPHLLHLVVQCSTPPPPYVNTMGITSPPPTYSIWWCSVAPVAGRMFLSAHPCCSSVNTLVGHHIAIIALPAFSCVSKHLLPQLGNSSHPISSP